LILKIAAFEMIIGQAFERRNPYKTNNTQATELTSLKALKCFMVNDANNTPVAM
jgi:hypothetical protein